MDNKELAQQIIKHVYGIIRPIAGDPEALNSVEVQQCISKCGSALMTAARPNGTPAAILQKTWDNIKDYEIEYKK